MDLQSQQDAVVPQPQAIGKGSSLMWGTAAEQLETDSMGNGISSGTGTSSDFGGLSLSHGHDWQLASSVWGQRPRSSSSNQDHSSNYSEAAADISQRSLPGNYPAMADPMSSVHQVFPTSLLLSKCHHYEKI